MIRLIAFTALAVFSSIGAWGCQRSEDFPNGSLSEWIPLGRDWKGAKEHIISPEEWQAEISEKMDRLQAFLKEEGLLSPVLRCQPVRSFDPPAGGLRTSGPDGCPPPVNTTGPARKHCVGSV